MSVGISSEASANSELRGSGVETDSEEKVGGLTEVSGVGEPEIITEGYKGDGIDDG